MTLYDKEALFSAYLNNSLTSEQEKQFNGLCESDAEFAQAVENSARLNSASVSFVSPALPQWDKEQTFFKKDKPRSLSSWFSLPACAMAMSACALIAVLTGAKLTYSDNGVALSFLNNNPNSIDEMVEQRVTQEVAKALGEQREFYQQTNQTLFKEYAQALSTQQQQSSAELTKYLLASSREERKQDFAELIKFINEQRIDDQRFYARQFTRLQDEIDDIEIGYSAVNLPNGRTEVPITMPYQTNNPQSSLDD
ncbi:hypothetical protein [Alteromonas portus]|uniref:hypothetical protein n=1 Tax=Alteromonas portus TaxID=2565549 RepID=UPI003BF818FC